MEIKKGQIVKKIPILIEKKKLVTDEGNNKMDEKKTLRDKQNRIWSEKKIPIDERNTKMDKKNEAKEKDDGKNRMAK